MNRSSLYVSSDSFAIGNSLLLQTHHALEETQSIFIIHTCVIMNLELIVGNEITKVQKIPLNRNFATNVNPLGPPKWVPEFLQGSFEYLTHYPELWHHDLDAHLSKEWNIKNDRVLAISGTSELLFLLPTLLPHSASNIWACLKPTFWEYPLSAEMSGIVMKSFLLDSLGLDKADLAFYRESLLGFLEKNKPSVFFLCSPNNPTGHIIKKDLIYEIANMFPSMLVIVDHTYALFLKDYESHIVSADTSPENIITIVSYSKLFCLPGLRIGAVVLPTSQMAKTFRNTLGPLRVNSIAEILTPRLLADHNYISETRSLIVNEWHNFEKDLSNLIKWLTPLPSFACFKMLKVSLEGINGIELRDKLLVNSGIKVCSGEIYGISNHIRIRIGTRAANNYLLENLLHLFPS